MSQFNKPNFFSLPHSIQTDLLETCRTHKFDVLEYYESLSETNLNMLFSRAKNIIENELEYLNDCWDKTWPQ